MTQPALKYNEKDQFGNELAALGTKLVPQRLWKEDRLKYKQATTQKIKQSKNVNRTACL